MGNKVEKKYPKFCKYCGVKLVELDQPRAFNEFTGESVKMLLAPSNHTYYLNINE